MLVTAALADCRGQVGSEWANAVTEFWVESRHKITTAMRAEIHRLERALAEAIRERDGARNELRTAMRELEEVREKLGKIGRK